MSYLRMCHPASYFASSFLYLSAMEQHHKLNPLFLKWRINAIIKSNYSIECRVPVSACGIIPYAVFSFTSTASEGMMQKCSLQFPLNVSEGML